MHPWTTTQSLTTDRHLIFSVSIRQSRPSTRGARHRTTSDVMVPNRPPIRPHFCATPLDQTDSARHVSLKTIDLRDEIDTAQQFESSF